MAFCGHTERILQLKLMMIYYSTLYIIKLNYNVILHSNRTSIYHGVLLGAKTMNMYSNMFTPIPVLSDHFNIKCFNYGFYDLQVLYVAENKLLGFYIMPSHEILSI